MRQIVLEGPDNSGKSTLASHLSDKLGLRVQHSGGPEKYPGEINVRTIKYLDLTETVIFDRHPCISHNIYTLFKDRSFVDNRLTDEFYRRPNLLVSCISQGFETHKIKLGETEDHAEMLNRHHRDIWERYRVWSERHAHVMYRVGDGYETVLKLIKGWLND